MVSVKKISKSGSVTVPKELRRDMHINPGDAFEVETDDRGNIILKRYSSHCVFCESTDDVGIFKDKPVCKECVKELKKGGLTDGLQG